MVLLEENLFTLYLSDFYNILPLPFSNRHEFSFFLLSGSQALNTP